jgi:hypothetical protein
MRPFDIWALTASKYVTQRQGALRMQKLRLKLRLDMSSGRINSYLRHCDEPLVQRQSRSITAWAQRQSVMCTFPSTTDALSRVQTKRPGNRRFIPSPPRPFFHRACVMRCRMQVRVGFCKDKYTTQFNILYKTSRLRLYLEFDPHLAPTH